MWLWKAHRTDKEMLEEVLKHIDTEEYGIGLTKFKAIRKSLGLHCTRQQGHTTESIHSVMVHLHEMYPKAGVCKTISLLFHEMDMSVSRSIVHEYFTTYEPNLVRQRKAQHLQQRRFWAAGVNDIWAIDQHNKWLRFGLALHTGIEPFSGRIMWMHIWHSNRNPQLILSYYLDVVDELGYIPLVTQSNPGTENFGIANAQTMLRQWHDRSLLGTLQHRWMRTKKNVMPEITWSQLQCHFTPGFESLLDRGVQQGWYNCDNTLQQLIFYWVFIPWLQCKLDAYRNRVNYTAKRHDRNKVLPHGVPELIHSATEDYGALDFKVIVDRAAIEHVHKVYINSAHPMFDLVSPAFGAFLEKCYTMLQRPPIGHGNAWTVYREMLALIQRQEEAQALHESIMDVEMPAEHLPLIEGLEDLPFNETDGNYYMGGVGGGLGLCKLSMKFLLTSG
ncbi:hypothetical protein M404DRAFT_148569 [Pisolithus tinctorius Marx 270]|uniref:Integrase core domain-containing protein n=1 Tax=Pisolithus tinctorius Marx 270 TaxID=870435 RepID=A0A0C3P4E4_PISTI|nr:hypothetical protein M404DRAFT_148569 [Pisolithus tinctorius Marx 270]